MSIGRNFDIESVRVLSIRSDPIRSGPIRSGPVRSDPGFANGLLQVNTAYFDLGSTGDRLLSKSITRRF